MSITEACDEINKSSVKDARILAMKLISSIVIEENLDDKELVIERLGIKYYTYIQNELNQLFCKDK